MNSIRKIDKNIGIIPNWGDDDFDANVHENFTDLKEIIPAINNTVDDIDLAVNKMNILNNQGEAVAASASNSASVATQKASEANASANQALTYKNQLQAYVIPAGTSYSVDQQNTQNSAITKAQFNALAEERKANRAGSGFNEFGKHVIDSIYPKVNEGIFTGNSYSNYFRIGYSGTSAVGTSKSEYSIVNINRVNQSLSFAGQSAVGASIILPQAPNIYPYDTVITAEQIASGVIKHADASNSGLIVNGKFDTDTSGWTAYASILSVDSGRLKITSSDTQGGRARQVINTIVGKEYIVESLQENGTSENTLYVVPLAVYSTSGALLVTQSSGRFTATTTTTTLLIVNSSTTASTFSYADNIAVYPADAISRSDLVFLESWHEDVSEKNFVYPLGNVQYLGGNTDGLTGIANGAFTGFETYSLFENWQTPSPLIGKGYVWSTLIEVQKRAFIANPENNCYLDGDKIIQVRYRVRVLIGEDTNSMAKATVQGKAVVPSTVLFTSPVTTVDAGLYSNTSATYTYTGTNTSAISIANVGRRNQGIYHNVYNPNGTKLASDELDCFRTAVSFASVSDCFDPAKLLAASGYIGTVSGRPDGLFYDQIHEGDILDLRNSSKKSADKSRLISREFNKLVAGTYRGKEGEWEVVTKSDVTLTFGNYFSGVNTNNYLLQPNSILPLNQGSYTGIVTIIVKSGVSAGKIIKAEAITIDASYFQIRATLGPVRFTDGSIVPILTGTVVDVIFARQTTRTKSNTLLHCDIIGNPTNYPTSWKQNGVFGTPLIVAEDGTSLLPNGVLDSFKLSRKANAIPILCLRSTDSGLTWTNFTPTFSTTTNTITLTNELATNLVMVYYQTHTSMAVPTVNSEVVEIGKVLGTDGLTNAHFISTLIGKVATANTAPYLQMGYDVNAYRIDASTLKFSTTATELPVHSALSLAGGASGVPAVKVLPYLTRLNGKAYLNLAFKEMKHNGTSWGDDSKFNIVDNVSTTTDNNAQTILIGQKTVELPYFIGADE